MNLNKYKCIASGLAISGLLLVGLFLLLNGTPQIARAAPGDLFVTPGGSGDCSQANPCDLQTALSTASDGDTIYIAGGTYTGAGGAVITVTRSITLYGGWDGTTTTPPVRDPEAHPTTLNGERERRVIYIGPFITPTIDGFIITGGNATNASAYPRCGGGICGVATNPLIADNVITNNLGSTDTGGWGYGGGIYLASTYSAPGTAVITANEVLSNVASTGNRGYGGAIYVSNAPAAQVVNNLVLSNTASMTNERGYGGGIGVLGSDSAIVADNEVRFNVASTGNRGYGGGIYLDSATSAQVVNNVVLSNTASITGGLGYGGGIAFLSSNGATVTGNRVEHNVAQGGPAALWGSDGGGIFCYLSDEVTFDNNTIRYNIASVPANGSGGGIRLHGCDRVAIAGNTLQSNWGSVGSGNGYGGGLSVYASRDLTISANRIVSNTASASKWGWGGGLYLSRNTTFTMTNNIVAANGANYKGGGLAFDTDVSEAVTGTLAHNTFAANDRGSGDGRIAIHLNDPYVTLVLTNNLIYSHTYGVYVTAGSTATLYHTLLSAHSSGDTGGSGSIVNTDPITGQDPLLTPDYHLQSGSPAIDAGLTLPWLTTDIDGDARPQGTGYDIGADEFTLRHIYLPLVLRNYQHSASENFSSQERPHNNRMNPTALSRAQIGGLTRFWLVF